MVQELRERVKEMVPEQGDFAIVYSDFKNPDKGMGVTDWMLKVTKPPQKIDPTERKRYLELVAYNLPSPYIAEKVLGSGMKSDILNMLQDEDTLVTMIINKMPDMARDLEDI